MRKSLSVLIAGSLAAALVVAGAPAGASQTPLSGHQQHHPEQQPAKPGVQAKTTMDCQQMMAVRQEMMEDMKEADARLDELVQKMNAAAGDAKVAATAAAVTELVTQRKLMRERMSGMQSRMMQHMMQHMQGGGAKGAMECPMMKD
jgi:hypothetical protein